MKCTGRTAFSQIPHLIRIAMGGSRGGQGVRTPPPLKNHKTTGFLSNTCPDPLKNHKDTEPSFNVGTSSAHQRKWRADDGPLLVLFGSSLSSSKGPLWHNFQDRRMVPIWSSS